MRFVIAGFCLLFIALGHHYAAADQGYAVQVGNFFQKHNARDVINSLSDEDIECVTIGQEGRYRVVCGSSMDIGEARELRDKLEGEGYVDAFLTASGSEGPETARNYGDKEEPPIGNKGISGDIFGRKGGYFHPFLSLSVNYTDNVFNTKDNKKSDVLAVITPGIWISVPRVKQKLLDIATTSISPGGIPTSIFKERFSRRYQTYLLYRADIEQFKRFSSQNTVSHRIDGLFQYNFRGGLSLDLFDQYIKSHDMRGTGVSFEPDKFDTNLLGIMLTYDISDRFILRTDYRNYMVNYIDSRNNFRDRTDNAVSVYLFYRFFPKTSAFLEYEFVDIDYDENVIDDSKEDHFFTGIQWDITAKSKGRIKAGYGMKDFTRENDGREFLFELQLDHKFTPKTSLKLVATRKTNETNISTADYILSDGLRARYLQRFTAKISGSIGLSYNNDKYHGELTFGGETRERDDDIYSASLALQYEFREWLKTDLGYLYSRRDSNFSEFDYSNNTFFIRITGSL
ncbi:sporulation related domain protein [bacterium BMS3Bbin06]|nr:sporulation related domain protein [bacterium BMS3Abin08]GBE34248.1 sporulation related domain protein [bacterium BMS3Bbin06]